jgi:hypothetical protein
MKSNRPWRRLKRWLALVGVALRLKPFGIRLDFGVVRARLARYYDLLYRSRERVLVANFSCGALIAFSVYYLGQSALLENLLVRLALQALRLREFVSAHHLVAAPPVTPVLAQGVVILLAAGVCSYVSSMRRTLLLCSALVLLILAANRFGGEGAVLPLSSAFVVLLMAGGAGLDGYLERKSQQRLWRDVAGRQQGEHAILRHISHSINPTVQMALSPIRGVAAHLQERNQLGEVLALRRDGSCETVGAALETAQVGLQQIREILETTEAIFGGQVAAHDFQEVLLAQLFQQEIVPLFPEAGFQLQVNCSAAASARLHRPSFVQAVKNLVRNAQVHGFPDGFTPREAPYLRFEIRQTVKETLIDCSNNGVPFPHGFKTRDFLAFGRKGKHSPGKGLGGAWVQKCVEIHGGSFQKLSNNPVRFRITLPRRRG